MVTSEGTDEISGMTQRLLDDQFRHEVEFGSIVVLPRIDFDSIEFLQSYIVFSGDQDRLDTQAVRLAVEAIAGARIPEHAGPVLRRTVGLA